MRQDFVTSSDTAVRKFKEMDCELPLINDFRFIYTFGPIYFK